MIKVKAKGLTVKVEMVLTKGKLIALQNALASYGSELGQELSRQLDSAVNDPGNGLSEDMRR